MPLNGLRSVPLPFNEADSILDENAADLVQQQLQRGESLQSICEAISSSYEGYPDMIRMVLSWGERIGIPSEGLLREATVCALRDHESKVVGYVEQHNGECWPRTRKATRRLLCDELWRPELLDMAGRHPATIFARGVLNERMLHDSQVDGDVFESSATVAQQVLSLLDSLRDYSINNSTASGDSAELQRKIEWTCDVIAKISWNEEISGCTVMDTLQNCSNHSPDPLVRLTCVKAMKTTINYLSTMITQTKLERKESLTGKQRTKAVLPNGTGYNDMKESTLVLSMKMMFVVSAAQLNARFWNPALFDAVIGLLDSNTRVTTRPTLAAKRRMDRHFVTLTKTIHALVGVIRLTARESASNAAKGNGLGNGFTNGKKKGADENSDDDLEVDVVETETETETTMPMGMKVLFLRWLAAPQMMASVTAALFTGDGPTTASHGSGLGHMGMTPSPLVMTNGIGANFAAQEERHTQCLALVLAAGSVSSLYSDAELERRLTTARLDSYLRERIQRRYDVVREALNACGLVRPTHNALRIHRASLGRVLSCMRLDGGVARGVVLWIDDGITHGTPESLASQTACYLALLEAVLLLHGTLLVTQVADVMLRLFDKSVDGLRASIVTGFASLCTLNICNNSMDDDDASGKTEQQQHGDDDYHVGTIIMREFQQKWIPMEQLSKALIRTFVRLITQVVTKPYKAPFVTAMCTLLADPNVEKAVADDRKLATLVLQLKQDMYHLF